MPDRLPEGIDGRLREMAELSRRSLDSPRGREAMKARLLEAKRTAVVDMSPTAIDVRIRAVAGLRRLCLDLGDVSVAVPRASGSR